MNEETRLINPGFEGQTNQESENPQAPLMPEKKGVSTGTIVAGVAGGGVVGAAAAAGAAYLYDQSNSDEEVAVVEGEGEALAETAPEAVAEAPVQHVYHETVHVVHDTPHPHHHQQQHAPEAHATQASNHISGGTHTEVGDGPTTGGTVEESDVHVIGVDVVDNGQGGEAVVAYMEDRVDGQLAAVVDLDSDGTIDVLAVDENGNQHFEENEIHDVSGEGIQTMAYIESYAQEQGLSVEPDGGTTMAGYEEPDMGYTGEQDYYTAMDDTTADYVNDADTGLYEA